MPIQDDAKKKSLKPWHMGTPPIVFRESYPMNTNITGFKWFSKIVGFLCFGRSSLSIVGRGIYDDVEEIIILHVFILF